MSIYVTKAESFKSYLTFIDSWKIKRNISYHMQYIEFLCKVKKQHDPQYTTLSLINKTLIIEYFVIIEAILDALLRQLKVEFEEDCFVHLELSEYTPANDLLQLAKSYSIIDTTIHSQLGQIKNTRNRIHIKKPKKNQKDEYEEYTKELLNQHAKIFKNFMIYLFDKNKINYSAYPWPWKV